MVFITCAAIFQENAPLILNKIKGLGWLAPVFFLLLYCLATILLLPTLVLTLAGGALFGPLLGAIFNLIGATLGAACAFCISRYLAIDWGSSYDKSKLSKLIAGVERGGWQFAALLRLVPIVPFNLVNYGLGMTRIRFRSYLITTFVFLAPAEIVYTYCGYASRDVLSQPSSFYKISSILILLGTTALIVIGKLLRIYRFKNKQKY
jgi:uncharacterized membrane protein YdjX (TVP38/TMEM64 family)